MPIVTQTRSTPLSFDSVMQLGSTVYHQGTGVISFDTQTTTSFRTGRNYLSDEELYNRQSGEDLAKSIGREYRTRFDNGHEFSTEKLTTIYPQQTAVVYNPSYFGQCTYTGLIYPNVTGALSQYPDDSYLTSVDTNVEGAKFIARTIPTAAEAGLVQFIAELREQLPQLIGMHTVAHGVSTKSIGNEHLNVQFGLKPFIGDLKKLASSVFRAHKLIAQMQKDSGAIVRRHRSLPVKKDFVDRGSTGGGIYSTHFGTLDPVGSSLSSVGAIKVTDVLELETHFAGAYTYLLADGHSFMDKLEYYEQLANHLLGTRITPDVVWQITPWSWLLDWFADIGTLVKNVTALSSDSTVLRYGYLMLTLRATRERRVSLLYNAGCSGPSSVSSYSTRVLKKRYRATPYGFGINLGALSPQRWSILAALGMTKSSQNLRLVT